VDHRNIFFSCGPSYSQRFPSITKTFGTTDKGKTWQPCRTNRGKKKKSNKKNKQSTKPSTLSHKTTTIIQNVRVKFCFHSDFDNNNTLSYFNEKVKVGRYLKQVWPFNSNLGLFQFFRVNPPSVRFEVRVFGSRRFLGFLSVEDELWGA